MISAAGATGFGFTGLPGWIQFENSIPRTLPVDMSPVGRTATIL
jgi:hypothetical protein